MQVRPIPLALIAAACSLGGSVFVHAAESRAAGWVPHPGIEVSGSYGTVSRTSEGGAIAIPGGTYGGGWSAGATAEWNLAPTWRLVSGLRYVETREEEQSITVSASGTEDTFTLRSHLDDTWRWLAVPLRVRLTPWALPLSFEAGPEVQVLLAAKSRQHFEDGAQGSATGDASLHAPSFLPVPAGDYDVTNLYHRTNLVLGGGVSFAWPARSGRIIAHVRGGLGLNDLANSNVVVRRTHAVEVGAGWQW